VAKPLSSPCSPSSQPSGFPPCSHGAWADLPSLFYAPAPLLPCSDLALGFRPGPRPALVHELLPRPCRGVLLAPWCRASVSSSSPMAVLIQPLFPLCDFPWNSFLCGAQLQPVPSPMAPCPSGRASSLLCSPRRASCFLLARCRSSWSQHLCSLMALAAASRLPPTRPRPLRVLVPAPMRARFSAPRALVLLLFPARRAQLPRALSMLRRRSSSRRSPSSLTVIPVVPRFRCVRLNVGSRIQDVAPPRCEILTLTILYSISSSS
jgi:hypothetical protein